MEITEIQTSARPTEPRVTVAEALTPRRTFVRQHVAEAIKFLAIVVQFTLIAFVIDYWQLESRLLTRLLWMAFGGFIIHHLLPLRFRLPFFAILSLLAVISGLGHLGLNAGVDWLTGKITTIDFLYRTILGLAPVVIGLGLIGLYYSHCRCASPAGLL